MFVNRLQCFILFLPIALAKNLNNTNLSENFPTQDLHLKVDPKNNKTLPLLTEGGPINTLNTSIPSSKEARIDLLSVDKSELEVLEHTEPTPHLKIKPRKGAELNETVTNTTNGTVENITNEHHSVLRQDTTTNHTLPLVYAIKKLNISKNDTSKPINVPTNTKNQTPTVTHMNKTEKLVPKKPLLLSYEKLASMDNPSMAPVNVSPLKISETQSTVKSNVVTKELVRDSTPAAMKTPMLHTGHPEMVIPVVITMIVVPMFAMLGYMALKRGKEAWQNRHYKRMDFLLDGMYND